MNRIIENRFLRVEIQELGGSLHSVKDRAGREYLWQGDPAYWDGQAPNLFPYIGRMTDKKYVVDGKEYHMDIHGFVKDSLMKIASLDGDAVRLFLEDSEMTRQQYPFSFRYEVAYRLQDARIVIEYRVENRSRKTMYFGIGGHPGFNVPLEDGLRFEDYCLRFPEGTHMKRVNFTPACFVAGGAEEFPLEDGDVLPLRHDLFDQDAIILCDVPKEVSLISMRRDRPAAESAGRGVRAVFPQMDYLGIWHAPNTDAPYVCIEPWSSLPSRQDVVEDLAAQPGLVSLKAGGVYENRWEIEILGEEL